MPIRHSNHSRKVPKLIPLMQHHSLFPVVWLVALNYDCKASYRAQSNGKWWVRDKDKTNRCVITLRFSGGVFALWDRGRQQNTLIGDRHQQKNKHKWPKSAASSWLTNIFANGLLPRDILYLSVVPPLSHPKMVLFLSHVGVETVAMHWWSLFV